MFKEVSSQVNFVEMEEKVLEFWREHDTFSKSLELRQGAPRYVFYEGPPTANGRPGLHHVLARAFKDLFPRYKTMRGYLVHRRAGWDTHGLPVELEIEKELGITAKGKRAIEEYGIAKFNAKCRESVFRYVEDWEKMTERIAFWIDMDDPYVTLTNEYIESVWWILKQFWDRDLIYEGFKVVPYCPRCGTPLSSHELALGYKQTEDPSIYVKFPLRDDDPLARQGKRAGGPESGTYLLSWTTTPWTLAGNAALAVHPEVEYVMVQQEGERLILAKDLLDEALEGEYKVVKSLRAEDLVGRHYKPLYTFLPVDKDYCYVISGDFVTTKEGTGIVHIAPAFGEDDLNVGQEYDLPVLQTVDLKGAFIGEVTPWHGLFVKDADRLIIEDLVSRGLMYRSGTYEHIYPFCWRCDTPLLYYAKTSWFIETTRLKDRLLANNQKIGWHPEYIKDGRFGNWLESNVDWALGRERYWGTPLPIWECVACGERECIGSIEELKSKVRSPKSEVNEGSDPGLRTWDLERLDLHRPYIDEVTYKCGDCGGTMRRVPEVIDAWFDSGAMPVAQWHYPFENEGTFKEQFPADYICEGVDQTRGWFYSLHAIATLLFDQPAYTNVISLGLVLDATGRKMSKSLGNVIDPWSVLNEHGADALRWYLYTSTPLGHSYRFSIEVLVEGLRKFLITLWNTYAFFVTYANLDFRDWRLEVGTKTASQLLQGAESDSKIQLQTSNFQPLDRWILAELNALVQRVDKALEGYDVTGAARPIQDFVEDLSNWYVRRSRRRFWKSEQDEDKAAAYLTLYECLVTLAKLLAPFTPFIAEEIYRNLVCSLDATAPESVHLCRFPLADEALIDEKLMADVRLAMRVASLGHAARNRAGLKVRQPLAQAVVKMRRPEERDSLQPLADQVMEELNVKELLFVEDESRLVDYVVKPLPSLLGPKYGKLFPKIQAAVAQLDGDELAAKLQAGEAVKVDVEGQTISLLPEEMEIETVEKEGYAVASEGGYLVGVTTALTAELVQEGLARELVRRIQTMRKEADFRIEDTIVTYYQTGLTLGRVMEGYSDYIKQETLSKALVPQKPPAEAHMQNFEIDGQEITLGVVRSVRK